MAQQDCPINVISNFIKTSHILSLFLKEASRSNKNVKEFYVQPKKKKI